MKILWFTIFGIPPVGIFVFLPTVALVWEQAMDKQEEREKAIKLFDTVIENSQPWEKIALILDGKRASLTIGGVYRGELLD